MLKLTSCKHISGNKNGEAKGIDLESMQRKRVAERFIKFVKISRLQIFQRVQKGAGWNCRGGGRHGEGGGRLVDNDSWCCDIKK